MNVDDLIISDRDWCKWYMNHVRDNLKKSKSKSNKKFWLKMLKFASDWKKELNDKGVVF